MLFDASFGRHQMSSSDKRFEAALDLWNVVVDEEAARFVEKGPRDVVHRASVFGTRSRSMGVISPVRVTSTRIVSPVMGSAAVVNCPVWPSRQKR